LEIKFREVNPFDVWIWLEFATIPSEPGKQYIEEIFNSWFFLGKLGGFNAENMQIQEYGVEISYLDYSTEASDQSLMALMHNMGEVEYQGTWARCWFDLGTSDAIALDVLINAFLQFNQDYVTISQLVIGGQNEDWPIDERRRSDLQGDHSYN
jgi:Protein of unknown function (DUF3531)